ncbi:MAG: replication endonuclease [Pseudohongiella sp.]|nr:replication endonuclease [Pseudohongiella sp.]
MDANKAPLCPAYKSESERLTWHIGTPDDRRWREKQFKVLPFQFQTPIARTYCNLYARSGCQSANFYLLEVAKRFSSLLCRLSIDSDELRNYAKLRAAGCRQVLSEAFSEITAYSKLERSLNRLGFLPPAIEDPITLSGALNRLSNERWWRSMLHSKALTSFENTAIQSGLTHSKAGLYISDEAFRAVASKRVRNNEILQSLIAINELGQEYTLGYLASLSVSNPVNRRNELMARLSGFDVTAKKLNHTGLFITITCPSRMHPRFKSSGDINPKYDLTTPKQAQQYLCKLWARIRTKLNNNGIHIYGFRVSEPQHDGTPHWHLLLYTAPKHVKRIMREIKSYALQDSSDERGASKIRCNYKLIDWTKGTGVGYIAKYISKNIDGMHLDKDLHGESAEQSAKRVTAWASVHGIRQFQQFGGPTVTSWRELRKIDQAPEGILSDAREAADLGNWELFTEIFGGIECRRKDQRVQLLRVYSDEPGLYGEPKGECVIGVTSGSENLVTRYHVWTIEKAKNASEVPNAVR